MSDYKETVRRQDKILEQGLENLKKGLKHFEEEQSIRDFIKKSLRFKVFDRVDGASYQEGNKVSLMCGDEEITSFYIFNSRRGVEVRETFFDEENQSKYDKESKLD